WRTFPRGSLVRRGAAASGVFLVLEALIGAGLVLLELVAGNTSVARAWWMAGHLLNTFLLIGALTLTAWWTTHDARPRLRGAGARAGTLAAALAVMLVLGVSGAVTALGDPLFPATSLAAGETQTFSAASHVFLRLRVWHPVLALTAAALAVIAAIHAARTRSEPAVHLAARALVGLFGLNLAVGLLNLWWLAPVPLQHAHLLLA